MTNRLAEVYALGQSPWCDTIARDQIQQGTFQLMIERDAIIGVTSNPPLFQQVDLSVSDGLPPGRFKSRFSAHAGPLAGRFELLMWEVSRAKPPTLITC